MKNLVIVESPTKAKTISKFLGEDYTIKFSMGHVMDLPKSKLSIDLENDFAPQYEVIDDKKKIIAELKKLAKTSDTILLATDPDREGEAISANIEELLLDGKKIAKDKFQRIVFHEITEEAIKEALKHPRALDVHLVHAQTARRVLDRLVGYKISPLLWKKVRRGLSAGRVQSVALRFIAEREREIEKFAKQDYWTISATLQKTKNQALKTKNDSVAFALVEINGEKIDLQEKFDLYDGEYTVGKTVLDTELKASDIVKELTSKPFVVVDIVQKQMRRSPLPPFATSTLQQEAARRFGFPGKRTMSIAQKLYEEGLITYHRTDSVTLSSAAINVVRSFISKSYGESYLPGEARLYVTKQKSAQEAHEAIRPTNIAKTVDVVKGELEDAYAKLYDLIWRRTVASQMKDALIDSTAVIADAKADSVYRFKANGSVLVFDGFLKLTPQALEDTKLPQFETGEELASADIRAEKHETSAPPRYNDASLIKTLEEKGIGRPSTYASIISTITDRAYVERVDRRFTPTAIGVAVNDFLVANFSTIDDAPFSAQMEDDLDEIANGRKEWVAMMSQFYAPFEKQLDGVEGAERVKIAVEELDEKCPDCGSPLVVRYGKFGKFVSCSTFPDCKFTKPLVEETNLICPKDGAKIIIKKTRKGRKFYGCSSYPACDFAAWKIEDIKKT